MRYFSIIGIWFAVLIGDGIVIPGLTGLPSGFGIIVILSALAITFGIHRWVINFGIVLAVLTELLLGAYFGSIIGAWLIMASVWHLLDRFLNMRPIDENNSLAALAPFTLLGLGLFGLGESAMWAIGHFVYEPGLAPLPLFYIMSSPVIFGIVSGELVLILLIFRFIFYSRNSIYAQ